MLDTAQAKFESWPGWNSDSVGSEAEAIDSKRGTSVYARVANDQAIFDSTCGSYSASRLVGSAEDDIDSSSGACWNFRLENDQAMFDSCCGVASCSFGSDADAIAVRKGGSSHFRTANDHAVFANYTTLYSATCRPTAAAHAARRRPSGGGRAATRATSQAWSRPCGWRAAKKVTLSPTLSPSRCEQCTKASLWNMDWSSEQPRVPKPFDAPAEATQPENVPSSSAHTAASGTGPAAGITSRAAGYPLWFRTTLKDRTSPTPHFTASALFRKTSLSKMASASGHLMNP